MKTIQEEIVEEYLAKVMKRIFGIFLTIAVIYVLIFAGMGLYDKWADNHVQFLSQHHIVKR